MTIRELVAKYGERVLDAEVAVEYPSGFNSDNYESGCDLWYKPEDNILVASSVDRHS